MHGPQLSVRVKVADPTTTSDTNNPETNGSKQLVTGGTVFNENAHQRKKTTNGQAKTYNYLNAKQIQPGKKLGKPLILL